MKSRFVLLPTALATFAVAGFAQAGIVNGDFESGNTGFTTAYAFRTVSDGVNYGQYGVTHSSWEWSHFWSTITSDHTTGNGTGQFLIVDVGPNGTIWQQDVAVSASTQYNFGAWISTWTPFTAATLQVEINGSLIASWGGPGGATWTQHSIAWNSGAATTASIRLFAAGFFQPGDDIAIDDISLNAVPAPGAGAAAMFGFAGLGIARRRR